MPGEIHQVWIETNYLPELSMAVSGTFEGVLFIVRRFLPLPAAVDLMTDVFPRIESALDQATAKVARIQAVWQDIATKFLPAFSQKWGILNATRNNLVALVNDLAAQDQVWLRADCDPAILVAVFTELNNRVDEVKEQATMSVTEYIKRCNDDERTLKE